MKSSRGVSFARKLFMVSGLAVILLSSLFFSQGCQNSPSGGTTDTTEVYVANLGAQSVMVYELTRNGTLPDTPVRIIRGPATGIHNPFDVAIDGLGRAWVANLGDPAGTQPSITVYEPGVNGNAAPSFSFALESRGDAVAPGCLTKFTTESMLAGGPLSIGGFPVSGTTNADFIIIKPTIDSTTSFFAPSFDGASAELINPAGIAFWSNPVSDSLFVATSALPMIAGFYPLPNPPTSSVLIFNRGPNGFNPVSVASITGNNTGLSNPAHIEFDDAGNLYVLNRGIPGSSNSRPSICVFARGQTGNVAPARIIQGQQTGLVTPGNPYGIAVTEDGRIFVSTENRVLVFEPGAHGNVQPFDILENTALSSSKNAELSSPVGIAVRKK